MRLSYLHIREAGAFNHLLDGLTIAFEGVDSDDPDHLSTTCFVGPNGSGKSQLLQTLAEIFQDAWHTHAPSQERAAASGSLTFELIYEITPTDGTYREVRLARASKQRPQIVMDIKKNDEWVEVASSSILYGELLPSLVVGYTSGGNETLSLPFFRSRAAYAKEVSTAALDPVRRGQEVPDSRLLLVDYGTNLEVLIANLMLGSTDLSSLILEHAGLQGLSSWRCVIQLHPSTVTKTTPIEGRRGVKLTEELESIITRLRACSTTQHHDSQSDTYTLDFLVDDQTRVAFQHHWRGASDLYRSFHKLAMLNDLAVPRKARSRLDHQISRGRFASRLPEPQDEQKVFRFEEVRFKSSVGNRLPVDYVALSDGEHQQAQIFGVIAMITDHNALFLLDEPESHFNPQWRIQFVTRINALAAGRGAGRHLLMTSHAPFVPSDLHREQVVILNRTSSGVVARSPRNETFGASFDRILKDCFEIEPPISQVARDKIQELLTTTDAREIEEALPSIAASVEKAFLIDRLNQVKNEDM